MPPRGRGQVRGHQELDVGSRGWQQKGPNKAGLGGLVVCVMETLCISVMVVPDCMHLRSLPNCTRKTDKPVNLVQMVEIYTYLLNEKGMMEQGLLITLQSRLYK